jgi:glycosyltransferase involved in cell wall biosynthesis
MRLLIVWFMFLDSFSAHNNIRLFETIAGEGHEVACLLPVVRRTPLQDLGKLHVTQVAVGTSNQILSYLIFSIRVMAYLLSTHKFDVVIVTTNMLPWMVPLLVVRKLHGTVGNERIAVRESSPPVGVKSTHRYYELVLRAFTIRLCRLCDVVFGVSPMHSKEIAEKAKIARVYVWPPSVDEQLFDPRRYVRIRTTKRKTLNVASRFVFLYHGLVSSERGLDALLQAITLAVKQAPDIVLLILGRGDDEARLQLASHYYGLQGKVIFHEAVPYEYVPEFIAAADAGVVPLPLEQQWVNQTPIKLLEYLAMEKPVVISATAGHKWIIGDEDQAFFCGANKPEQIVRALLECRVSHAKGDRAAVVARFSKTAVARQVLKTLSR